MWRASPTKVSPTKDDVEAPPSPTLRRREARRRAKTTSADSSIASLSSFVAAASVAAVAYSLCVFLPAWTRIGAARWRRTVTVCPRPSICAEGWIEVLLLAVARTTAYAALPYLVALFLTKARVSAARWEENVGSILVAADNLHETHEACGWRVAGFAVLHTIAHFARCLVTFYLREGLLDAVDIALVFYTGKTPLSHLEADLRGRSSVYLVDGRPGDLGEVVLDVVEAVETHQALPECRFRPTELLGGYGGGPENGAPARFDALLRRCAARGMGASEISASFRTETLHRARSRSLADRPRPGRADGRLRRTMGPWANFGTVDGGDESDDDGDLVSEEDIASGIDLLSTSQMLVEDDDLGDILRHIAAGKRALTYSALVSHCERVCRGTQDEFELLMSVVASEEPPRPKRAPRKLCANWGLMYCGNVVRVERDLRAIGRQIDAPVAVERFDW